ncbi:MAG: Uma2 family endonuclease [Nitrospirae bacterium]|nr:Uma2 family endonuclease [Nitrospirota bacterium]
METIARDFDLTEIINGEEIMGPSPFGKHQDIIMNIIRTILFHLQKNDVGKLCVSPLDVILEDAINRLQPDIIFIRKENLAIFQDWIRGVPDMVCEIVSPGSYRKDTAIKKKVYEKYKVPEYWIVIPELQTIEILTIENDRYETHSYAELEGIVTSKIIEGLQVNINDIFG